MKFDPESPKFTEACKRLAIDMKDIERKKLSEFEAQIRNERPEEDQNPVLIRELATIRYNYYLTTFKEIFNDVLEERRHIVHEEINQFHNQRSKLVSRESAVAKYKADEIRKNTSSNSQQILTERL